MSKTALFLMCSLLGFLPGASTEGKGANEEVANPIAQRVLKSSVWLSPALMSGMGVGTGAAVTINGNKAILSAEHVAISMASLMVNVCSFGYDCVPGNDKFLFDSSNNLSDDWAVYFIDEYPEGVRPARVSKQELSIGDDIWSVGMAWGESPMVVKGSIAWVQEVNGVKMYTVNGYCVPGFSGGGVFNTRGELIGITVAIRVSEMGPQENYSLVVPISQIPLLN